MKCIPSFVLRDLSWSPVKYLLMKESPEVPRSSAHKGVTYAIFTERDLMSKVLPMKKDLGLLAVGSYASSPLVTVAPTTDVKEAARIMAEMKVRRLVVVEDGKPIGVFTSADLAKAVGRLPLDL